MKKICFLLLTATLFLSLVYPDENLFASKESKKELVYICDSKGAKKYHLNKNCRGLNACNHEIIEVTKKKAEEKGKTTLCGFED